MPYAINRRTLFLQLIFVSATPKSGEFESLSVPLTAILSTKFEQPFFGQNFLVVEIKPAPEGGLTAGTKAEIRLKDKGLFEFVGILEKTRERAIYMKRASADEEEGLRRSWLILYITVAHLASCTPSRLFDTVEHRWTVCCYRHSGGSSSRL